MENKLSAIESALVTNDMSKLTTDQRMNYYKQVCESLGLNPLTQPLSYINLNGKLTLYAKRDATDQLRKIHGISINITSRELVGDVYMVTAKAKDATGREDESIGTVCIANLKGDALANAYLKSETKAKRRVTLSICGLGLLDENEVDTIPAAVKHPELDFQSHPPDVPVVRQEPIATEPPPQKEPERFPKPEQIRITREQADQMKSYGLTQGWTMEQMAHFIYTEFKFIRWGEMNQIQFAAMEKHIGANPK